jgi:hypothetical protein
VAQGGLIAAGSGEEVVPASDYRALQNQVRELHRLLGKKTLEAEILKEALEHSTGSKKQLRLPPSLPKDGSRRRLWQRSSGSLAPTSWSACRNDRRSGRRPLPDEKFVAEIKG